MLLLLTVLLAPMAHASEGDKCSVNSNQAVTNVGEENMEHIYNGYYSFPGTGRDFHRDTCHRNLKRLLGCVEHHDYSLHFMAGLRAVREKWLACTFAKDPKNEELLRNKVNMLLPGTIQEYLENFKQSPQFLSRFRADVEERDREVIVEHMRVPVEKSILEFAEWKGEAVSWVNGRMKDLTDEMIENLEKMKHMDLFKLAQDWTNSSNTGSNTGQPKHDTSAYELIDPVI